MREARRDGDRIVVRFAYDASIVERMRRAGGRWDAMARVWTFGLTQEAALLSAIDGAGFSLIGLGGREVEATETPGLRVSEVMARCADAIRDVFAGDFWVVAELSGVERAYQRNRDALYFELLDREAETTTASISARLQGDARHLVERRLREAGLSAADGLRVRVRGRLELWSRGSLALRIIDLDPAYSMGEIAMRRERVIQAITAEGLARRQLERPLPSVPLRVALITSDGSDAYHDIVKALGASGHPFVVTVFDCRVQGAELERTALAALRAVSAAAAEFDVAIVSRGGGGRSELSQWDNLSIARAIARLAIKVIVAIGHERDQSALDVIALSARTPTAAAELLVRRLDEAVAALEDSALRLDEAARNELLDARGAVREVARATRQAVLRRTAIERTRLSQAPRVARAALDGRRRSARDQLARAERRLRSPSMVRRVSALGVLLQRVVTRVAPQLTRRFEADRRAITGHASALEAAMAHRIREARASVEVAAARRAAADPARILARGFAIVRDAEGRSVREIAEVEVGARVQIELVGGTLDARIEGRGACKPESKRQEKE